MNSRTIKILRIALPLIIILVGIIAFKGVMSQKKKPVRKPVKYTGLLVETIDVSRTSADSIINGSGVVNPSANVKIIARSTGTVIWVNPSLKTGMKLKKGDVLLKIDPADYEIAVKQSMASYEQAKYELTKLESEAEIARKQWEQWKTMKKSLVGGEDAKAHPLTLFEPQILNAKASLKSAEASLEKTKLELARTVIRAPFDAVINSESIDMGQYVKSGEQVAELFGLEYMEVIVPVTLKELEAVKKGSVKDLNAEVSIGDGGTKYIWKAYVDRILSTVESSGKLYQVVVVIPDPLNNEIMPAAKVFASVKIKGKEIDNVFIIPRAGYREDSRVYLFDDGKLKIKKADKIWEDADNIWITTGLEEGDKLIITPVAGPVEGMTVRHKSFDSNKSQEKK